MISPSFAKIQLIFPAYALMAPNECDLNFIEIFGQKTDLRHRLRHFCGSKIDIVLSKSHILHLRLYAHHTALRSTFDAIFTAVTPYRETEGRTLLYPFVDQSNDFDVFYHFSHAQMHR